MHRLHHASIDSTNEAAKRLFHQGEPGVITATLDHPVLITADAQTAGKGTQGRVWVSPAGAGLYVSIIHTRHADQPLPLDTHYTMAAGLACREALAALFDLSIDLKPVNDLYARHPRTGRYHKLGGILTESIVQDNRLQALITGIGVNVDTAERTLAESAHPGVTPIALQALIAGSAHQALKTETGWTALLETLSRCVGRQYARIVASEQTALEADYQRALIAL